MDTKARDLEIANTILAQLGGSRALAMLGSKIHSDVAPTSMGIRIKIKGCRKANLLIIQLDADDTYHVRLVKRTGGRWSDKIMDVTPIKEKGVFSQEGVYVDSLRGVIEGATGLYLSL